MLKILKSLNKRYIAAIKYMHIGTRLIQRKTYETIYFFKKYASEKGACQKTLITAFYYFTQWEVLKAMCTLYTEMYLGPSQTSMMEFCYENH